MRWMHLVLAAAACGAAGGCATAPPSPPADPYLWLEDVQGERALGWVREHNRATEARLQALPTYRTLHERIRGVLDSPQRIPYVVQHGDHVYNLWNDAAHVRGLWRRTTLADYQREQPAWEPVLDLDQLARDEHERWVWHGADCLPPQGERCLLSFSRGGGDAHVVREFDLKTRRFVEGGFVLPEAKSYTSWLDKDTIAVATHFGPGSLTQSGYPRVVKAWRRGTPLSEARILFEGDDADVSVDAWSDFTPGHERQFIERRTGFFTSQMFLRRGERWERLNKPDDARVIPFGDQLLIELRSDWTVGGTTYPAGALLAADDAALLVAEPSLRLVYRPTDTSALQQVVPVHDAVLLVEMDDVRHRLLEVRRDAAGQWQRRIVPTPAMGTVSVSALDPERSNRYLLTTADFLTPTTLSLGEAGRDRAEPLKALPAWFDAKGYTVEQRHATSRDGTRVPYFVVRGRGAAAGSTRPTLLYGYGGFEISMKPSYSGTIGRAWLDQGGVYVLANIRGGGEFGPRWHQAAQKEHRQRSYDDFIAVAEDLVARGITAPKQLGIMGGSLGGMLVSVAMLQRPELFGAVVSQVPLTDMKRYHRMLAGASWIAEYGNPDVPEEWAYIAPYSPYHNVRPDRRYPPVLYTSSTRDDRVHPGHARKMVALLQEQGHEVLYWENTEGGHGGAADNAQQAQLLAQVYAFLLSRLATK